MIRRAETPPRDPQQILEEQAREIERLREDLRRSEAERQRLRRENDKLKEELDAARRAVSRQAAPFSRGTRTPTPKRPGRKAGRAYGRRAHRGAPLRVDETYDAPLPASCPHCAGVIRAERVATQYQEELPVQRPLVRRFDIHIGQCTVCRRRVQGRHPLQTSDALGAAAVQLGPQAVAFAVLLNKRYGLPSGKLAALFHDRFGLTVTRGGLVHAIYRAARQAQPTYALLCETVRGSPVVTIDETSWRVDADLQWLWAYVTPETTVYAIQPGRGLAQAARVIGLDYAGVLQRDGWHSYRCFTAALHQTCLAHLLRRCRVLLLDHPGQPFVTAVKAVLQAALATREAYRTGTVSAHGLAVARGQRVAVDGSYARTALPAALASASHDDANQITTWAGTTLSYDANGNLTFDGTNSYSWNTRNQLSGISGGVSGSFAYDAFGRRRSETIGSTTTQFLYDGINPVQELSSGTPIANLLTGFAPDSYYTRTDASGVRNFLTDALGSSVALTDGSGTVQTEYTYQPFGATTTSGSSTTNSFGFTGREADGTGLYYYRARYYDARLQRFIAEDPLGQAGGVNLFSYAANQPTRYRDPLGLKPDEGGGPTGQPKDPGTPSGPPRAPGQPQTPEKPCVPIVAAAPPKGERNWEKNARRMDDDLAREATKIAKEQNPRAAKEWLENEIRTQGNTWSKARLAKLRGLAKVLGKSAIILSILPELIWPETVGGPEADFPPPTQGSSPLSPCR